MTAQEESPRSVSTDSGRKIAYTRRVAAGTRTELIELMSSGRFSEIVGTEEGEQVDFKSHAYNLEQAKDRADLAADIAAFANSKGGSIVLGVETEVATTSKRERASRVVGINPDVVDEEAYRARIRASVRPLVRDFEIRKYSDAADGRTIVALHVDPQDGSDQPFMVDRVIDDNRPTREVRHAVGWPIRSGADTHWEEASRIQQLVSLGLRQREILPAQAVSTSAEEDAANQLALLSERIPDWRESPIFAMQAIPMGITQMDDFYSLPSTIKLWRGVRTHGFGFEYSSVMPLEGYLASIDESGPSLVLAPSGVATGAAKISESYLGWAQTFTAERLVINATALIEFITEFVRFTYGIIGPALTPPMPSWHFQCRARRWIQGSARVTLSVPRALRPITYRAPNSSEFDVIVESSGEPMRDAAAVTTAVLGRGFALPRDQIPYMSDAGIDLELIPDY